MSVRGREALTEDLESLPEVWEGFGGSPAGVGGVYTTYRRSGWGREDRPQVREGSGGPPTGPGGVGRPSQMFVRPSQRFGRG